MTLPEIGFIGAGKIGEPMVEQLLAAARRVTVYVRCEKVRDGLAALGAKIAETPAERAFAPVVITCLFTDARVLELCTLIIEKMGLGGVFISHATGSPVAIRQLGESAVKSGVSVLLAGGDDEATEAAAQSVKAYAFVEGPQVCPFGHRRSGYRHLRHSGSGGTRADGPDRRDGGVVTTRRGNW